MLLPQTASEWLRFEPIVVYLGWYVKIVKKLPGGAVQVLNLKQLESYPGRRPALVTEEQVSALRWALEQRLREPQAAAA